jgi:hypothetical protein
MEVEMKTYSVAIKHKHPYLKLNDPSWHADWLNRGNFYWITNWHQSLELDEINWNKVKEFVDEDDDCIGYGYYYGHNSRNLSSARCRTVLWEQEIS